MVSVSAISCVDSGGLQNARSQDSGNCMVFRKADSVDGTGAGSGCRRRRTGAGRSRRSAAWSGGPAPCRRRSRCTARGPGPCCAPPEVHLAGARHLQPAASQARSGTGCRSRRRFGEGEEARAEAQREVVAFEEGAAEVGEDDLQVLEAHVLAQPQAFALVEHRRVRGVAVHAVGAAGAITRISGMGSPRCTASA